MSDIKPIQSWLAPRDPVLTDAAVSVSLLAYDREERTCLWVGSHLTRFLRGQNKILSINGRPGCGKSIASSVIIDYLQRPILGVRYNALFIPISMSLRGAHLLPPYPGTVPSFLFSVSNARPR